MEGVAVRLMALQRPELRQDYEWGKRIKRDSEAMRRIIYREVRGADTAIDVGANIGELSEWFFEAAPRGNHHLVEPLPDLAADLRRRFPLAVVHECALSDTNGKAEFFHVVEAHGWSGLHRQDVVADKKTVSISVGVRRLDELVESASIKLIKIDVEGAELGVLRGAERLLGRDRPIILFEHASIHADAYGTSSEQVWTLLAEAGYLLAPVSEESRVLNLDEFRALNERSQRNNYNRHAHTNWVARPR
jgi:FkbM family methyltransferase